MVDAGAFAVVPGRAASCARAPQPRAARAATVVLWLSVVIAAVVALGAAVGLRAEVVLTGSMQPALSPGDMLVVRQVSIREVRVGDIVSFRSPATPGAVMTHRVRSLSGTEGGRIAVETRGDANNTSERWTIARTGSVGRVLATVPEAGRLTGWARDRTARLILTILLTALLAFHGLRWAWSR